MMLMNRLIRRSIASNVVRDASHSETMQKFKPTMLKTIQLINDFFHWNERTFEPAYLYLERVLKNFGDIIDFVTISFSLELF